MKHFAFPEIGQYRQAIRAVKQKTHTIGVDANGDNIYDGTIPLPKIRYRGTVKLHGTNSGIAKDVVTGEISIQSRQNIITVEKDNYGFARFISEVNIGDLFNTIPNVDIPPAVDASEDEKNVIVIYGEWCGGNIQDNVALTQLPKMFVVFAVRYKGAWLTEEYLHEVKLPGVKIYNILDYPSYEVEIDFNNPELVQNQFVDITMNVEKECPFSKMFGVSGVGEGVVYRPIDLNKYPSSSYWFKVKGDKHSVTKVKQLASVDVERMETIGEFISTSVTENRLRQGEKILLSQFQVACLEKRHIGDMIRWMVNDIKKEECDTIVKSGLSESDVSAAIAKATRNWFLKNIA